MCAGLFIIGVTAEDDTHAETNEAAGGRDEAGEGAGGHAEATEAAGGDADHDESAEQERILGVDVESPGAVVLAVAASLTLAVGLWIRDQRWLAVSAAAVALVFAAFDVVEIGHRIDESQTGLAVLAAAIAAGHLAAAASAGLSTRRSLGRR